MMDTGGGLGVSKILDNVKRMGLIPNQISTVFLSHCHFDHIGGAYEIKERLGCRLLSHSADAGSIESLDDYSLYEVGKTWGLSFKAPKLDEYILDGERIKVGDIVFNILHTPGHTPGCITIQFTEKDGMNSLLVGDVAFQGGKLGFINGPGFDLSAWKNSIKRLMTAKPDRLYPGHNTFLLSGATEDLEITDQKMNAPWTNIVTSLG
jgi:glyoxylase-like metal-dependent hydrolase (beta-lactamase superfamily II)